ncbi:MAG: peptidoglycan editing factor PgeF [Planctomycetota bacterium]
MLERVKLHDCVVYQSPLLRGLGVPHAFGTRAGDAPVLAKALGLASHRWVTVRQVHGKRVHQEDRVPVNDHDDPRGEADAVVLRRADGVTRILTADCVPILLASTDGRAVAAVHAGWRGLTQHVIAEAVNTLASPFIAAIGPSISAARFEVGPEVAEQFDPRFIRSDLGSRPHIDLRAVCHATLHNLGAQAIDTTDRCTYLHRDDFFSHRRDVTHHGNPTTGRMASVIAPAV